MEDATRSVLEQLESEAVYLIRESAALFDSPALIVGKDRRSRVLEKLARSAFAPEECPLSQVGDRSGPFDAYLSPETGQFDVWPLFGKPPKPGGAWNVYPLASWSERDLALYDEGREDDEPCRLLRLCTVGEPQSGKSTVVRGLLNCSTVSAQPDENATHQHVITPERRLFVIDPPGQEPTSHGLMAAAAASEAALLVVDARRGLTTTAKRQAFLLALMGVPHLVVVVNKMDLVGFSRQVYEGIVADFAALVSLLDVKSLSHVPLAALSGENLARPSESMAWYEGAPTLLAHLQSLSPGSVRNLTDLRLTVQRVFKDGVTRFGGRLASGRIALGDKVLLLPCGQETEVVSLQRGRLWPTSAYAGDSVCVEVKDKLEASWGDLLASPHSLPTRSSEIEGIMVWLGDCPQQWETTYLLHHGTRLVNAHVSHVVSTLDPESLIWGGGENLSEGQIGRVRLITAAPLYFDSHTANRETGAFTLLHAETRNVLGAGVLRGPALDLPDVKATAERLKSDNVVRDPTLVGLRQREQAYGHKAAVLWFTGLSGSGKSSVAKEVEKRLFARGCHTLFLDGDNVRAGLNGDLGFTEEARTESTRRVAELSALAFEQGQIAVCSFISGKMSDRAFVRSLIPEGHYFELYMSCPLEVCRSRDPKKLYEKADAGELLSFSGISIPYEAPESPDLELRSDSEDVTMLADKVLELLEERGVLRPLY